MLEDQERMNENKKCAMHMNRGTGEIERESERGKGEVYEQKKTQG